VLAGSGRRHADGSTIWEVADDTWTAVSARLAATMLLIPEPQVMATVVGALKVPTPCSTIMSAGLLGPIVG
jgi:hypothetical protein